MTADPELKRARSAGLRYLSRRDHTEHEVRLHLKKKGFSPTAIRHAMDYLRQYDYLNDTRFAARWGRARIDSKKVGRARLRAEMTAKGLDADLVNATLQSLYADLDENALARDCAHKKLASLRTQDTATQRRRLGQFLQRRGFSPNTIYRTLDDLIPL